jgi:anaphase-promoting complex subunit 1
VSVQVANVWSTKFGIVFERVVETTRKVTYSSVSDTHSTVGNYPQLPTVFALLHPLDEVSPVLAKHGKCET